MITGQSRVARFLATSLVALCQFAPAAPQAAEDIEGQDPFDPRRPPAVELELSVRDGFTLATVGDCIISRPLFQKRASDAGFDAAVEILRGADAAFGNLETSIVDIRAFRGFPDSGADDWGLISLPAVAGDLAKLGFDLLARANNHSLDWGIAGMRETSRWLDEAGLVHAGVGENRGLARAPQYFESEKGRIALVSMATSYKASSAATPAVRSTAGRPGLNALRLERYTVVPLEIMTALAGIERAMDDARRKLEDAPRRDVEAAADPPAELALFDTKFRLGEEFAYRYEMNAIDLAEILASVRLGKQHADLLVATIHAHESAFDGDSPGDFLRELARLAIDAGADVFVVHGIHHLGPIEVYAGKPIFFGLANFFWSDAQEPLDPILHETYAAQVSEALGDPEAATDADLTALLNATSFDNERTFQSIIAVSRFEEGRVAEIRLHPIDLGYGLRIPDSGVPRLASPATAREILERLAAISEPYGTRISIRKSVGIIRAEIP
jgi:poly-gamma-glutamate synthesis protein (capsule biosynthesis protein)